MRDYRFWLGLSAVFLLTVGFWLFAARDTRSPVDSKSTEIAEADIAPELSTSALVPSSDVEELNAPDSSVLEISETDEQPYIVNCTGRIFSEDGSSDVGDVEADMPSEGWEMLMEESEKEQITPQQLNNLVIESLEADMSIDSQVVRAVLASGSQQAISELKAVVDRQPQNALAQTMLLQFCTQSDSDCDASIESNAIRYFGSNGDIWFRIAGLRLGRDDQAGALEAINQAASASIYDEYWPEAIELFVRTLPLSTIKSVYLDNGFASEYEYGEYSDQSLSMTYSFGLASGNTLPAYGNITGYCNAEGADRADIAKACLQLGQNMADKGQTMISNSVGMGLQERMYTAMGDDVSAVAIAKKNEELRASFGSKLLAKATLLTVYDDDVAMFWFQQMKAEGEYQANADLIDEAIRLSADPNYNPCPSINDRSVVN